MTSVLVGRIPVENPATGAVFAHVPACSLPELDAAVGAAAAAYPGWSRRPEGDRRAALLACGAAMAAHADDIAELLTREQGKPLRSARAEVQLAVDWFAHTAALTVRPERLVDGEGAEVTLERVPHGVVAAIAPSNYPIILAVTKIAPALLAGNTVVLKPSPTTPLSTLRMGEALRDTLPPGVLAVAVGGVEVGRALAGHPDVRLVSFTGSVAAGQAIGGNAVAHAKRVILELGGNDPCIVLPDADIAAVAPQIYRRSMENGGQFCAAVKRVYVPRAHQAGLVQGPREVEFDAIASAEQQYLGATAASQHAIGLGMAGEIFARFHVRIVMAQSDAEQIHGVCIWAVKVIPQRSVNAALNPMMQSAATRFGANHRRCRPCKISP